MRILLVEDDESLGESLRAWLQMDGYAVDWLRCGNLAEAALLAHDYEAVLLDRGLPGMDGDAILERMRQQRSSLPVLLLTARDTVQDRVQGLDLGADDYLVKPFDLDEMSARLRAILRRRASTPARTLTHADVELDPAAKTVIQGRLLVSLTAKEFTLLQALMRRPGQVLSRAQLEEALYGWGEEVESNTIEAHVYNLRKKLGGKFILTVRNVGYRLNQE